MFVIIDDDKIFDVKKGCANYEAMKKEAPNLSGTSFSVASELLA